MPSSTRASSPQHCAQRSLSTRAKQRQRYHRRTATAIPSVSLCHIQTAGQHATDWRKGSQLSRDIKSKCSGKNTAFSYEPLYSEWRQNLLCIYIEFIHLKKIYKKIFIFVLRWKRSQCVTLKSKPEGTYHIISAFFFFVVVCFCLLRIQTRCVWDPSVPVPFWPILLLFLLPATPNKCCGHLNKCSISIECRREREQVNFCVNVWNCDILPKPDDR